MHSSNEVNDKDPKFKVNDHVRISKYKNILGKGYTSNLSKEVFVIKKVKNTVPWTYVINDLNGEEIIETFYGKELQKTNQQELRIKKVIKEKLINYMSNGKIMITHLIAGLIKRFSVILLIAISLIATSLYKNELIFPKTVWTIWWRY